MSLSFDASLDALGLYCPIPVILTQKKIKEMDEGQVLEVLADDRGIKKDMPLWCRQTGNELLELSESEGIFRIYVRKTKT